MHFNTKLEKSSPVSPSKIKVTKINITDCRREILNISFCKITKITIINNITKISAAGFIYLMDKFIHRFANDKIKQNNIIVFELLLLLNKTTQNK